MASVVPISSSTSSANRNTSSTYTGVTTELDPASVDIFGVGTSSTDVPGQRTYHLSWTASVIDTDGTAIPIVGSFEFLFTDDWQIVLFYVGTLDDWKAQPNDPIRDSFCEAGRNPWGG